MSDRTDQTIINLAYECLGTAEQLRAFLKRLHQIAPHVVSETQVIAAQQRVDRLKSMLQGLQKAAKQ